jgi:hypothetical protein
MPRRLIVGTARRRQQRQRPHQGGQSCAARWTGRGGAPDAIAGRDTDAEVTLMEYQPERRELILPRCDMLGVYRVLAALDAA